MKNFYLQKAEENLDEINRHTVIPNIASNEFHDGDELVLDLGNHYVGYFSFVMDYKNMYIDAPVRLYIKFCESLAETEEDFSEYKGVLCRSWLQDETVNIDFPGEYKMPRRYAARYIKIKVIAASIEFILSKFKFTAVTSAHIDNLKKLNIADSKLKKIDEVSCNTLKNCMQRVFEDGPKRDRRLWTGDLRLEALANYRTYNNLELVRRCLYLFAAADTNAYGIIPAYIYEYPEFVSGYWFLMDYALLFVASLCDYYEHTSDKNTFYDLYPVAKMQMEAVHNSLDSDGIVTVPAGCEVFIDWCEGLEKITAMQGVYMYVLKKFSDVFEKLSDESEKLYRERYNCALKSSEKVLYNSEKNMFVNKKDNYQYSVHSTVWMILGGVIAGEKARDALFDALNSKENIKPFTPYMHHYVLEAMFKLGLKDEAFEYMKQYWGGMTDIGADTFFEVFVPDNPEFSPYKDKKMNSMCHAWSCTPTYFIREYLCD